MPLSCYHRFRINTLLLRNEVYINVSITSMKLTQQHLASRFGRRNDRRKKSNKTLSDTARNPRGEAIQCNPMNVELSQSRWGAGAGAGNK